MSRRSIHFNISERRVLLRLFDIVFVFVALGFVGNMYEFDYFSITTENWKWIVILIIYLSVFGSVFELYDLQKSSKIETVWIGILLTTSVTVLFYMLTPFFTPVLPENRLQIGYFYLSIFTAIFVWRFIYINLISSPRFYKKVLLIGETSNIESILEAFSKADPNYKIIGFINCEAKKRRDKEVKSVQLINLKEYFPKQLFKVIKSENVTEVVIATYNPENITSRIYKDLMQLLDTGMPIKEYTQVYEELTQSVPVQYVGKDFYKYFPFSRTNHNKLYLFFHRIFDVLLSLIGVLFSFSLVPFVVIGNILGNKGPLFYVQERVGKNGKLFKIIKYRTMVTDAEKNGAVWAKKNDSRITPFGKFMRNTRIDEMPQFINVLKGEMSLIGPRPERLHFVKELSKTLPFYETRHIIKPGLTGWAQVKTRYGSSIDDSLVKLQHDLYYIKHRSFTLDVTILVKTLSTVIFLRGQ